MKNSKLKILSLCVLGALAVALTGCAAFKVQVPAASLRISKDGSVTWTSPKDTKLVGLSVVMSTNGTFTATVASWEDLLNPTNVTATANGQADLIRANGEAVVGSINAAANAAGAFAATAAKTAVKP